MACGRHFITHFLPGLIGPDGKNEPSWELFFAEACPIDGSQVNHGVCAECVCI